LRMLGLSFIDKLFYKIVLTVNKFYSKIKAK
jgi:hypothetical protein